MPIYYSIHDTIEMGLGPKALGPIALAIFAPVVPPWPYKPLRPTAPQIVPLGF